MERQEHRGAPQMGVFCKENTKPPPPTREPARLCQRSWHSSKAQNSLQGQEERLGHKITPRGGRPQGPSPPLI